MGKKSDPPPPPDYSQIAAASQKAAELSFKLGQDQLAWAKEQFAHNSAVSDSVIDAALGRQEVNDANAAHDRARYEQIFQPLEEQLAYDAQNWASPQKKEQAAGAAEAGVAQKFQDARVAAQSKLEQYGVDPSQTRAGALDLQSRVAEAAAQAGAGNQARTALDAQQMALRSEAINVGRGYPGQIAGQYGTALQSANQGVNTGLATTMSGSQSMGTPTQWQGLGTQALGQWGNIIHQGYQDQLSAWQAQQSQNSGLGSLLGTGLGIAASFIPGFAGGGPVTSGVTAIPAPPPQAIPVGGPAHNGAMVPARASPSRGGVPDDVPAHLTAGEFVIPQDTVRWKGEEFFQKMIQKERQKAAGAQAQPQRAALPGAPAQALPVR